MLVEISPILLHNFVRARTRKKPCVELDMVPKELILNIHHQGSYLSALLVTLFKPF